MLIKEKQIKETKYFDYKFYEIERNIRMLLIGLIIFGVSFWLGYWCKNGEYEDTINRQAIEIVDLKEQIHINSVKYEVKK